MTINLKEVIAPSFYSVHNAIKNNKYTHFLLGGGRGSTKSSFVAIEIILNMMKDPKANAVVLRKVKDTLKDSVYEQLCWAIDILGVDGYWHKSISPLTLTYLQTGQQIKFKGLDEPKKLKSTKFRKGYCKYIWYEEFEEFSGMEEIRNVNQSLMRGGTRFVVFYTYNPPQSSSSWVNIEAKLTRPDRLVHKSNYLNVPKKWLGEQFILEAEHLKQTKIEQYKHEYLGKIIGTGGEVFKNVSIRPISDEEIKEFQVIHRGLDYGYAADPLSYLVCSYDRKHKRLFIYFEIYQAGLSNLNAYRLIDEENKFNDLIIAESAEPKSNNEMRQYGLRVRAVKKGPDSVEFGIKFLQSLEEIVIDDIRCPKTAWEFIHYELARDGNGNFKAGYPDKNNHSLDACRYALNDECINFREEQTQKKNGNTQSSFSQKPEPNPFSIGTTPDDSYINF